jgi:tetratricopeptide (TPR) repeat protein
MKKYILYIASAILTVTWNGCYDLDRYPDYNVSAGTFWQTQQHADQAMAGVYSMLQNDRVFGTVFGMDCLGSIGSGYDDAAYSNIGRGTYTATESAVVNKWTALYEGIARSNLVLQNIDRIDMSGELKTQYIAEAKFMRALFYNELLNYFGGVPVYDESWVIGESFNDMKEPRSSADQVREFIYGDLDAAIASLPEEGARSASDYGRATKGAAQALKGKVYLFNKQYAEAAGMFEAVKNSGKYALYPDYGNLFKPGGDESNEMIFAVQNLGGVGQDYGMPTTFYMGTRSSYGSCWDNVTAATEFVDSYEYKDGKRFDWEDWFPGFTSNNAVKEEVFVASLSSDNKTVVKYPAAKEKLLEMYGQRDPRMQASLILPYTVYKGWVSEKPTDCEYVIATGTHESNGFIRVNNSWYIYLWRKFVAEYNMDGLINNRADTPINFPLIRYADVLLMLAECYNEQGKQAEAVALVNQVRARVGMPGINSGPEWLAANNKDEVFKRIKHERAVELAAEGHSFADYKRWKLLETLHREMKGITGKLYYNRVVRERDYLWPVPTAEIDKNDLLEQNPGW